MKTMKILTVLLIMVVAIGFISTEVCAAYEWNVERFDTITSDVDDEAQNIVGAIISITRIIALGVAIIMLVVLAMKYMMAAPGDRADIKKHAVVYVVGAIVLFGATGILTIIQTFAGNI